MNMNLLLSKKLFQGQAIKIFPDWVACNAFAFNRILLKPELNGMLENPATWNSLVGTKEWDFQTLPTNEKIGYLHPKKPGSAWYVTDISCPCPMPKWKKGTECTLIAGPGEEFAGINSAFLSYLGIKPGTELEGGDLLRPFYYQHCGQPLAYLMPVAGEFSPKLTYDFWRNQ